MDTWTESQAAAQLERLVDAAMAGRPQRVATDDGAVVIVSADEYERPAGSGTGQRGRACGTMMNPIA